MPPRTPRPRTPSAAPGGRPVRLQRVMAEAGIASRRECERMIEQGQVEVNGELVTKLPVLVNPRTDRVVVDGRPLQRWSRSGREGATSGGRYIYIMLNKPERTVTTTRDEEELAGRRTVMDLVKHPSGARLYPVGRLDYNTTGLLLLTNHGALANRLTHPRFAIPKVYWAAVRGAVAPANLPEIDKAVRAAERKAAYTAPRPEPGQAAPRRRRTPGRTEFRIVKREPGKTVLEITMTHGRIEHIREGLGAAGFPVRKLMRVRVGPLELKAVRVGEWRELDRAEIRALKRAAREAGPAPGAGDGKRGEAA